MIHKQTGQMAPWLHYNLTELQSQCGKKKLNILIRIALDTIRIISRKTMFRTDKKENVLVLKW